MRGLIYVVVLMVAAGCGVSVVHPQALDEAERMMERDPQAALSALNGLDVSEFEDSATMARWALLYSEAIAANKLSAPTDTIVDIAIDYYGRHNRASEFQKASMLKTLMREGKGDELATALYLQKEKEFLLYKERARRELYAYAAIIVLLAAAAMMMWMRQRMRLQALRNDALMAEASALRSRMDASRGDVCRLEQKLHGLLEKRFALIDSLCQTYYETQGTKVERKALVDKVKSEIDAVRKDAFAEMETAVNDCRGNLLVRVRECYAEMKPEEYQLLVYIASGLSARAISLLLGETVEVVYKRKSRLKSRLKSVAGAACADVTEIF